MAESIETLVARLQKANYAYHNGSVEQVLGDDEYDRQLEELRRRSPTHPFLKVIGAPVEGKGSVLLPYTMASLDKVRYGEVGRVSTSSHSPEDFPSTTPVRRVEQKPQEGGLSRWLKRSPTSDIVVMEKLDGLSALYVSTMNSKKMYLRGDGVKGVDVSRVCTSLGMLPVPCVIRGEILLPNEKTPEGSIGRSLVNGWLHRSLDMKAEVPAELRSCHFVAYQVIEPPGLTRSQQMTWLKSRGFRIPLTQTVKAKEITEDSAKEILVSWKASSKYPLDGIVLGFDKVPTASPGGEAKNPDDAVAFKAALDDQKAETTVVQVEWNLSRQNIYVPRIQIKPVVIGGARIEWLSGHNAALVESNSLGPGAQIIIRRSGDVIPTLDTVLKGVSPVFPEDGTWDSTHTQMMKKQSEGIEEGEKSIQHCLTTLGVEGVGPGLVKKLVEGGFTTMKKVYSADGSALGALIGAGRGPTLASDLRKKVEGASQVQLLIASNLLPRGVGERKLRTLYSIQADASNWTKSSLGNPSGWSETSIDELLSTLPKVFHWIESTFHSKGKIEEVSVKSIQQEAPVKYVVFTGCRVKELPSGWVMEDSVTKKTSLLVVADSAIDKETTKTKKAKDLGIKIVSLSEFTSL
jgi:NAD-dependent DNA ligase